MPISLPPSERTVAGNGDKIAQVQFGPPQATVFFLEGRLTAEHLKGAIESEGGDFIDVPGVRIDERTLTVRIFAARTHTVAIADSDGNVVSD